MSRHIIFLDFDRTLFDTNRFTARLWHEIAAAYKLDEVHQTAHLPQYYHSVGDLHYYDIGMHVQEVIGCTADEMAEAVRPKLAQEDFLFPDAYQALQLGQQFAGYELRILSFGQTWFQNFKMSFCPAISTLPRDIILAAKSQFVTTHFAGVKGVLVDDKRNRDLPEGIKEVWLDRKMHNNQSCDIIIINTLKQLPEVLHELH